MSLHIGDQRHDPRFVKRSSLQAEVLLSIDQPELTGMNIPCRSLNISREGIQVVLMQYVPVGVVLDLWIALLDSEPKTYHLTGEIRWIKPNEKEDAYLSGLHLQNGHPNDLDNWQHTTFIHEH